MSKNKISIIIPVFNSEKYLRNCLDSVINQTYRNLEILIINDCSSDKSDEICNIYLKKDSRIKYFKFKKNKGVSYARNYGLDKSTGEYLFFLDSDDCISKNTIIDLLNNSTNDTIVRAFNYSENKIYNMKDYLFKFIYGDVFGSCWGYLIRRDLCKSIRFDTNVSYMEDSLFILEILMKYKYVKFLKGDYYSYNFNEQSLTNINKNQEKKLIGYFYSIDKMVSIFDYYSFSIDSSKVYDRKIKLISDAFLSSSNISQAKELLNCNEIKCVIFNGNKNIINFLYFNCFLMFYLMVKLFFKNIIKH